MKPETKAAFEQFAAANEQYRTDELNRDIRCVALSREYQCTGTQMCHVTCCNCRGKWSMKTILASDLMGGILFDIQRERERQEILLIQGKFPWSCDNLGISDVKKLAVLAEEFGEASKEAAQIEEQYDRIAAVTKVAEGRLFAEQEVEYLGQLGRTIRDKRAELREELVQVAAVCVAWCEALDRQLDDRAEFKAEEQASLSSSLAVLVNPKEPQCNCDADPIHPVWVPCPVHDRLKRDETPEPPKCTGTLVHSEYVLCPVHDSKKERER